MHSTSFSQAVSRIHGSRIALIVPSPLIRMTGFQEEDFLIVLALGVGGRQVMRTLEWRTSPTTPMPGQSASRLGKPNTTSSLISQQTKEICQPLFEFYFLMLRKKLNKSVIVFEITAQSSYFCGDGIPFRAYLCVVKILLILLFSQMCLL